MKLICYFQIFFVKKKERNIYHVKVMLGKNFFVTPFWEIWICEEIFIYERNTSVIRQMIYCFPKG